MDKKFVKDKIKEAQDLVEGVDEPFKSAAFSVVLTKLLDENKNELHQKHEVPKESTSTKPPQSTGQQSGKKGLADSCKISIEELDKVLDIQENLIQLLIPLKEKNSENQRIVGKCILTAFSTVLGKEWVSSIVFNKCLEKSGVTLDHLAANLRAESDSIRIKGGGQGTDLEYTITGPGKVSAYEIIRKLAKGEEVLKSKSR